jgi:hypothetical protein
MAEEVELEYAVLNITAHPHTKGTYSTLLQRVAKHYVQFHGQDYAAISEPEMHGAGIYIGRILVWTELDPDSPAIDKTKLTETTVEEAGIKVPAAFGINGRTFFYALREKDHRFFYEERNELQRHLAPAYAKRILDRLFRTLRNVEVGVIVEPEEDALEKILAIPVLKTLEIHITIAPNPDENEKDTETVLKEMLEENVKAKQIKLTKKGGKKGIKPGKQTLMYARAANSNGFVKASGMESDKTPRTMSTAEYPRKILRAVGLEGVVASLTRVARDTIFRRKAE